MARSLVVLALSWSLTSAALVTATAQETRGTVAGYVTDAQGGLIPNATITLTAQDTGLSVATSTDAEGRYRFPLLFPGVYVLNVAASGFESRDETGVSLRVGEERRIDVVLGVAGVAANVTVEAPITSSATSTLATVLPEERVQNLPLNGRQLQELTLTVPGVTAAGGFRSSAFNQFGLATSNDGNGGAFSVNGGRSRSNGFFLDGADINVPEQGVIAFPPLVEAVKEAEIQTSVFKAEYGRYAGSIINYVTKSGSNSWRGSAYEYFRDAALDADDFFNKANGLPPTPLHLNQFGGTIGGPLQRNRHFVFGNYEANRVKQGTGPFASSVPTDAQRRGLLAYSAFTDANGNGRFDTGEATAPAMIDVGNRIVPTSRAINDGFIPLPNASSAGANYIANGLATMKEDAFAIRTDSQLSARDSVTVRYNYDFQDQYYPFDIFFTAASLPAFPFTNPERRQSLAASHTRTIGSAMANEFRFGLNRQSNPIPTLTLIDPASIGLPNGAPQNEFGRGLPIIRISGFGGAGGQPYTDNLGASTTNRTLYQFMDRLLVPRGRHTIKIGGEFRHARVDQTQYRTLRGSLMFNGTRNGLIDPAVPGNTAVAAFADFLLGLPAQAQISSADPARHFRTNAFSAYVQDDWFATDRLTLNIGLRYELDTPLTEGNGQISNLIPGVGNFVVGSDELPRLHRMDKNNLAPRAGFAYRLDPDGRTIVRGGAGIYYDNGVFQDRFSTARTNAPFAITAIDTNPAPFTADGSAATTFTRLLGSGQATSAAAIDLDFRTSSALQYNLGLQRELGRAFLAEVSYVGRRGSNQSRPVNINQVVAVNSPAATAQGLAVGSRPFAATSVPLAARFSNDIVQQQFNGESTYHALQTRLERRLSNGSSMLLAYTWSRSEDDASGIGSGGDDRPQDSYDLEAHRAVSNYDMPHRFVASGTWALPFGGGSLGPLVQGWQLDGILTWQSGQPFTVTIGAFDPVTGISNRRPNQVGDPAEAVPPGYAFNPAAFVLPPSGELGNTPRNSLRGDDYFNVDLALGRRFQLPIAGNRSVLQLRVEVFNLLNNVNFNFPVSTLSNAAFGRYVSNSTAPRIIQLGAKLQF